MTEQLQEIRFAFGKRIQAIFWLVLFGSNLYFGSFILGWKGALIRSALNLVCHLINFYVPYSILVPRFFEKKKFFLAISGAVGLIMFLTPIRILIERQFVLTDTFIGVFDRPGRLAFVLFTEISIGAFAALIRLAVNHEQSKRRVAKLEKLHLESELRFLKAQMNPHFLFNTINNIYSLTLIKSDKAGEALLKLSGLLRYLLYESQEKASLEKEIAVARTFAELFQLRYEQPISLSIESNISRAVTIEPLVLIPILENAVKHSGIGISPDAYVSLVVEERSDRIFITCKNSVTAVAPVSEQGGLGVPNIQKRLNLAYPGTHQLRIVKGSQEYELTLEIPMA